MSLLVLEWGEGVAEQLAEDHLLIRLTRHPEDSRTAELVPVGSDWPRRATAAAGLASLR